MSVETFMSRALIPVTLKLLFLRHQFELLEHEVHGNMGESYVYGFEAFRLYVGNDRGSYFAQLSQATPTDIWEVSLILEFWGVTKEGDRFAWHGVASLLKQLWLLSRNMARVRELFEGEDAGRIQSKLNEFERTKLEQQAAIAKRAAGY